MNHKYSMLIEHERKNHRKMSDKNIYES